MIFSWCLVLLAAVAPFYVVSQEDDELFEKCLVSVVCEDPEGVDNVLKCASKLSESDLKYVVDFFNDYFDIEGDLKNVIQIGCKDPEEGKKAFEKYYETRMAFENQTDFNSKDNEMLLEGRNCLFMMINECKEEEGGDSD